MAWISLVAWSNRLYKVNSIGISNSCLLIRQDFHYLVQFIFNATSCPSKEHKTVINGTTGNNNLSPERIMKTGSKSASRRLMPVDKSSERYINF
jgi:hypothetical protein